MPTVASIVEGDGEVAALPVLLRRLQAMLTPHRQDIRIARPIRVARSRFVQRPDEFERHLRLAAKHCGNDGWILIVLDADDDCPAQASSEMVRRAMVIVGHLPVSAVLANREYEAWFIAGAASLSDHRGLRFTADDLLVDPERPRDAKGWLSARRDVQRFGRYDPILDQPSLSSVVDLAQVRERSRSFRKLCKVWSERFATDPTHRDPP